MTGSASGRGLAVLTLVVVLLGSCVGTVDSPAPSSSIGPRQSAPAASGRPASDATASPSELPPMVSTQPTAPPTPPATPSATPLVEPEPGSLATVAVVEKDGVRVRIELERNPMPAGEITRVRTTIRNIGTRTVRWSTDGCATDVHVSGELQTAWPPGLEHEGAAQRFKDRALEWSMSPPRERPWIAFVLEEHLGRGSIGCADLAIAQELRPGEARRSVRAWDGYAYLRWGPPPAGPVLVTAVFDRFRIAGSGRGERRIEVTLDAWVVGAPSEPWLSPAEVVDAALADAAFMALVADQPLGNAYEELVWYRPERDIWEVGFVDWSLTNPVLRVANVDPRTGQVLDIAERPWDRDRDGAP